MLKLFTVGPVACYPTVLEAMGMQMISHRSKEYKNFHVETVQMLQNFLETENEVFLFSSTGSGFMEASVRNCVKKKMLCCICGSFGERYAEVATSNGKQVVKLEVPLGEPILPSLLDQKLSETPDVEAVAITHNETSMGLINPLKQLAEVTKKHGKLLFVDAVSSMGGTEIKVDEWGLDVCFSSSQKCFGVPPGLGVGSVSVEALKKSETVENKGWYFDFKVWEKNQKKKGTPMTSVIPQIAGLHRILKFIESKGGKHYFFDLYAERNRRIRQGVQKLRLTMFPKAGYESPTVNCVNAPVGIDGIKIYEMMRDEGFELAKGYGSVQNLTFRVGNMGYIESEDIDSMLQSLGSVLVKLGWEC
ncbi:aspartate aminotransferase [miscellaneous Crenarchaeota group-1 archaeon SG8-32-1]|uniref:Aspartate aminotransferase n=1 Tax=miscellaneous Crenarchaeota group-1 archaeon SG8-32-1 TaxID=1685124 RepID=A0A0M0BTS5_9ARCH|nr:MAG: aspartate aminotransferase [miscellaneous Crenarchaeota group-1 archaeon SG8-32-1]